MNEYERCIWLRALAIGSMSELAENGLFRETTHPSAYRTGISAAN